MRGSENKVVRVAVAILFVSGLGVAGCGGGERQDAHEPNGTFPVKVVKATFPTKQHLADQSSMAITVQNTGSKTVPNLAVTILGKGPEAARAFAEASAQPGLADPSRPIWVVDHGPRGGDTAYYNTWALGSLPPGQTKTFHWDVTAVTSGMHTISYKVAAGLNGKARAIGPGGIEPTGVFTINISGTAPKSHVDPATGQVVKSPPTQGAQ